MDWLRVTRVTAPTEALLTLTEARDHLRVMHDLDDGYIAHLIEVATSYIEGPSGAGIALLPSQWVLTMDQLPKCFDIDLCPVRSIDSITADGQVIDPALYSADLNSTPARVIGRYHPHCRSDFGRVKVTFTAGYETVPADLKHAALLLISHLYENREAVAAADFKVVPFAVEAILGRYRAFG
ncbi:head-tail connector protein [Novosphingobium sp.]|jgi:uncharacterized phiE125 gp8 family phage protein|uniref:head-tail connector protein n=1 Tax=Novosphingobium sp. TaxID=1874826 RepID=UPI002FE2544F